MFILRQVADLVLGATAGWLRCPLVIRMCSASTGAMSGPDPVLRRTSFRTVDSDRPCRSGRRPRCRPCRGVLLVAGRPLTSPASSSGLSVRTPGCLSGPRGWSNLQGFVAPADLGGRTRTAAGIALWVRPGQPTPCVVSVPVTSRRSVGKASLRSRPRRALRSRPSEHIPRSVEADARPSALGGTVTPSGRNPPQPGRTDAGCPLPAKARKIEANDEGLTPHYRVQGALESRQDECRMPGNCRPGIEIHRHNNDRE
jgi:hypothetical protein